MYLFCPGYQKVVMHPFTIKAVDVGAAGRRHMQGHMSSRAPGGKDQMYSCYYKNVKIKMSVLENLNVMKTTVFPHQPSHHQPSIWYDLKIVLIKLLAKLLKSKKKYRVIAMKWKKEKIGYSGKCRRRYEKKKLKDYSCTPGAIFRTGPRPGRAPRVR
jgi:hypothetical protein